MDFLDTIKKGESVFTVLTVHKKGRCLWLRFMISSQKILNPRLLIWVSSSEKYIADFGSLLGTRRVGEPGHGAKLYKVSYFPR